MIGKQESSNVQKGVVSAENIQSITHVMECNIGVPNDMSPKAVTL